VKPRQPTGKWIAVPHSTPAIQSTFHYGANSDRSRLPAREAFGLEDEREDERFSPIGEIFFAQNREVACVR
jgi:hypothetical protein